MKYMGIDYHKQHFVATTVDEEGRVLSKERVSTDRRSIRQYLSRANRGRDVKAVMEACYGWEYFYDEAEPLLEELIMAHPLKTRLIAEARIKTDSIDSESLAQLLRAGLIPEAYAPPFETRDKKALLRYRGALTGFKVMLKNIVHSVLARNHMEDKLFRSLSDKFGKKGKAYLRAVKLRGNDTEILNNYLDLLEEVEAKMRLVESHIRAVFKSDEICALLKTLPGVGAIISMLIRYEVDDIERFVSSGKLCSYAGLVPRTYSSGKRTYQGRITKQGNKWLRWAMVEAAQRAIVNDPGVRVFYLRIAEKKGSKLARVAVARRLLQIAYWVWKEKRPYKAAALFVV